MKKQTGSNSQKQMIFAAIASLLFMFGANSLAVAQEPNFKAGDRVEVNISNYSATTDWRKATIVEVMMWQGRISGIYVKTDDGKQFTTGVVNVRQLKVAAKKAEGNEQPLSGQTPDVEWGALRLPNQAPAR